MVGFNDALLAIAKLDMQFTKKSYAHFCITFGTALVTGRRTALYYPSAPA